jgi:hypothetical protein
LIFKGDFDGFVIFLKCPFAGIYGLYILNEFLFSCWVEMGKCQHICASRVDDIGNLWACCCGGLFRDDVDVELVVVGVGMLWLCCFLCVVGYGLGFGVELWKFVPDGEVTVLVVVDSVVILYLFFGK